MTTIPCFAAVATAKGELNKKQFRNTVIFWLVTSYVVSCIVYLFLLPFAEGASYWWSELLVVLIFGLIIGGAALYNAHKKRKAVA